MDKTKRVRCPVCGNKTRLQLRKNMELKNFDFNCPKCKQESLINAKDLQVTVIKENTQQGIADLTAGKP